ncbi:SGNH/GDSL hydrolase family protein [Arthrobacter sp. StoSoilB5]|uniref:SGNH/GDSL hydrolase family protein n=1 Tax=Arthrobacter sp. StoSoilB5 TaxID=2830992 RepID=UPI001CC3E9CC|nr:SGNH/GDSL hydrolase family protein [Arthrobacter sp. StoSoilB5]BCW43987.1 SGNH hydrolase [Arthrobacter sp. StoSoilB5]
MRWRGRVITRGLVDLKAGAEQNTKDRSHPWSRYVALGDSFTEGIGDPEPGSAGGLRGWADRVAEELAADHPDLAYANLAVRGLLLQQILDQQIGQALTLKPDLITLSAGGNDMVFHGSDPDKLASKLETGVSLLAETGAKIVLFTGPDWGSTPILGRNRGKVAIFNENVHAIAARHGTFITDLWALRQLKDPSMWDPDRLHLSPLGHHTVAMAVLDTLNVPHTLRPFEPKELPESSWRQARAGDLAWARAYFFPWVFKQLRPHGSVEERRAKRPSAGPVFESENPSEASKALVER